eukprot:4466167-Heterocapsa_arctica.AAC.1
MSAVSSPQVRQGGRSGGGSRKCHQRNGSGMRHGGSAAPILPGPARAQYQSARGRTRHQSAD